MQDNHDTSEFHWIHFRAALCAFHSSKHNYSTAQTTGSLVHGMCLQKWLNYLKNICTNIACMWLFAQFFYCTDGGALEAWFR